MKQIKFHQKAWATGEQFVFLCVIACALTSICLASPTSHGLIIKGADSLEKQKYEDALEKFNAAAKINPADSQAVFFQGAALNRLVRHAEALVHLEQAAKMGNRHPDIAFETGWSLLRLGRWKDAIDQLEQYEKAHTGRGQTSEFMGRAYLALGQDNKAEILLQEALRRDPKLKPTVHLALAALEQRRKNPQAVKQNLSILLAKKKPWQFSLTTSGGYNSNVIGLAEGIALPNDIAHADAGFGHFALGLSYNWRLNPREAVTTGYEFQSTVYNGIKSANLLDHLFFSNYNLVLAPNLTASFRLSDEFSQLRGSNFRNQLALRPSIAYRLTPWATTELAYNQAISKYYFTTPSAQDRSGIAHTVSLNNYFHPTNTKFKILLGYFYAVNGSNGGDFDLKTHGISVGLQHPLFWKIAGESSYSHLFNRYDNLHSLSGTAGYAFKRKDDINKVGVQLSRPINSWARIFVRYELMREESNIQLFNYKQEVTSSGVILQF